MISSDSFDMVVEVIEDLFFQGSSIGKLGLCVNGESKVLMSLTNFYKSKKMRGWGVYGMIYLGSIIYFRREKYRFVLVMISFSAFHFCTIIAVIVSSA